MKYDTAKALYKRKSSMACRNSFQGTWSIKLCTNFYLIFSVIESKYKSVRWTVVKFIAHKDDKVQKEFALHVWGHVKY